MIILAMLVIVVMYVEGMLTPSLPSIAGDFHVTISQVSLVLSTYLVGGVAFTPIVGKLGDIYGKKKVLTAILFIYLAAVFVTGFSPNFTFMVVSRTIQGVGMAIMPLGMSLVREEFPRDLVPKAQALISAMFGAGFAISLPLGSLVSNDFGWRVTYHTATPFVFILAIVTIFVIKESRFKRPETKIDIVGATLLSTVLGLFVFALSEGPTWGWTSTGILALFIIGAILMVPLVAYERGYTRKKGEAIVNFKLLSERNVLVANLALSISGMAMFLSMQALTYRLELPVPAGFGKSIVDTGLSLVPFAIGVLAMGPVTGALVSRTGVKPLAILGAVLSAVGFFMQATLPGYTGILIYEFITGAGLSLLNGSMINFVVLTVHPKDMGLATAMNGTFRSMGSGIGAPVAGSLMSTFTASFVIGVGGGLTITRLLPSHLAFTYTFLAASVAFMVSAIVILYGKEVLGRGQSRVRASSRSELKAEDAPAQ
ncbi:permease [uncultured archaeon]|nr:permease [uncultured archaeon]